MSTLQFLHRLRSLSLVPRLGWRRVQHRTEEVMDDICGCDSRNVGCGHDSMRRQSQGQYADAEPRETEAYHYHTQARLQRDQRRWDQNKSLHHFAQGYKAGGVKNTYTKFSPERPRIIRLTSRLVHPPISGVPAVTKLLSDSAG